MRNITTVLANLLDTRVATRAVVVAKSRVGEDLWLVADSISLAEEIVSGSGINVGDTILHEDGKLINNLGVVVITEVSV